MDPTWRLIRCFAGFFSAMLWIAAIADEVVEILQVRRSLPRLKFV
jgi:sodium/potassium/calcium exchanger 6